MYVYPGVTKCLHLYVKELLDITQNIDKRKMNSKIEYFSTLNGPKPAQKIGSI